MLRRAGIVLGAATAGLLVLSPLAHAADQQQEPPGSLVDLDDVNVLSNLAVCPDLTLPIAVGNVLGILGIGAASSTAADAPVTCAAVDADR